MSELFDDEACKELVQDLQRRGYTKYATTMEVKTEFELRYEQAYYRVKKHWVRPYAIT